MGGMVHPQPSLFDLHPRLPEGFVYQPDLLSPDEEVALVGKFADLPFAAFEFHGFLGRRRIVSFGQRYEFGAERLRDADPVPEFLIPLRDRAAAFGDVDPQDVHHAMVTEYAPGAPIGWHRDKAVFGKVIGVSLLSPCSFRFRRRREAGFDRATLTLAPRSVYLLDGPARWQWEHSIPPVDALRYSVTFRTLKAERG